MTPEQFFIGWLDSGMSLPDWTAYAAELASLSAADIVLCADGFWHTRAWVEAHGAERTVRHE